MTERVDKKPRKKSPRTPDSKTDNESPEAAVSEWMQIMLEEMERKRDEQEEAREELKSRSEDSPKSGSRSGSARRKRGAA
jgi:hypothetical protein